MTYFCSIGSQILYIFETHGIGQNPSSLERYLVIIIIHCPRNDTELSAAAQRTELVFLCRVTAIFTPATRHLRFQQSFSDLKFSPFLYHR